MTAMAWMYDNMNTTASLNADCIAAQKPGQEYLVCLHVDTKECVS